VTTYSTVRCPNCRAWPVRNTSPSDEQGHSSEMVALGLMALAGSRGFWVRQVVDARQPAEV
jgi:hypothetical protein